MKKLNETIKGIVKDYNKYCSEANKAAKKFERQHPVATVIGGVVTGLTVGLGITYAMYPEECNAFISNTVSNIKKKLNNKKSLDTEKKSSTKQVLYLEESVNVVDKENEVSQSQSMTGTLDVERYENYITSLSHLDILLELKALDTIIVINTDYSKNVNSELLYKCHAKARVIEKVLLEKRYVEYESSLLYKRYSYNEYELIKDYASINDESYECFLKSLNVTSRDAESKSLVQMREIFETYLSTKTNNEKKSIINLLLFKDYQCTY